MTIPAEEADNGEGCLAANPASGSVSRPLTETTDSAAGTEVAPRVHPGSSLAAGRFHIKQQIGAGGAGVVYRVFDAVRDSDVALKALARVDPDGIYRLKQELRCVRELVHPNIASAYELFAEGGDWFFSMEFIEGVAFDRWVRPERQGSRELDEQRLRSALVQLVAGVRAIHEAQLLHRDLKPSNVLVTRSGRVLVLDFGLAMARQEGGVGHTIQENTLTGTPAYMAPEQAAGDVATPASDLYAVGVMLFEALTGGLPFSGSAQQIISRKQLREPPLSVLTEGHVPTDLASLCGALIARDPRARPDIAAIEAALGAPPSGMPRPAMHARLTGRAQELATLRAAFRASQEGVPTLVCVSGESGIGKTTLCHAFLDEVSQTDDVLVLAGSCYEGESVPFKAFDGLIDALSRQLRRLPEALAASVLPREVYALARLFPVLSRVPVVASAPTRAVDSGPALRRCAFDALAELLLRCRDRWPVVLHVDDVQWSDRDSVTFMRHLLLQPAPAPVLLVLSHRGDGTMVQAILEAAHVNRNLQVQTLRLEALSSTEALELASQLLAGTSDVDILHRIGTESAGNPWFLSMLADAALGDPTSLPSLTELFTARLAGLSEQTRELAKVLALAGRPLALEVALEASGSRNLDVDPLVRQRIARRWLDADQVTLQCYHDRIRDYIVAQLTHDERKRLYAGLARAAGAREGVDLDQLCVYYLGAGLDDLAANCAERAADRATTVLAFDHAAALYQTALRHGSPVDVARTALVIKHAQALADAGRCADAAEQFLAAAGATHERARKLDLQRRAADQLLSAGHPEQGFALLRDVCRETGVSLPSGAVHAFTSFVWKITRLRLGGFRLEQRTSPASEWEKLQLQTAHSALLGFLSYLPPQSASMAAQYLSMALAAGDRGHIIPAFGFTAYVCWSVSPNGRLARRLRASMQAHSSEQDGPVMRGFVAGAHGANAYRSTAFREARAHLRETIESAARFGGDPWTLDVACLFDQLSAFCCGDWAEIARNTPLLIEDALRRGRIWRAVVLCGIGGTPVGLTFDDPQACLAQIERARVLWRPLSDPGWPDYFLCLGEAVTRLYAQDAAGALALLERQRNAFDRMRLSKGGGTGNVMFPVWQANCALARLVEEPNGREADACRSTLRVSMASLRSLPHAVWRGTVARIEAALAVQTGQLQLAQERLTVAEQQFEAGHADMWLAATRRRLGELIAGREGAQLIAAADTFMAHQGVRNAERLTELLCPGCVPGRA